MVLRECCMQLDFVQGAGFVGIAVSLETGLIVQVPLFVNVGDVIRVDTRTGEYQTRV